ncbi:MAG TPA: DUF6798 domain-containing protein [Phycisphaerae bacterium]|nr:DUF6798 domain-containing protein [Phycisphaerae bacterium]
MRAFQNGAAWILLCLLLALAQIAWAGYALGFGNQGIQIPFLETLHDHSLFTRDVMVAQTLGSYPSFFFHLCGGLLDLLSLPTLYLLLHILTTTAVFAAAAFLARSLFKDVRVVLATLLLLLAGQHAGLAGVTLYSQGFTHTWAVFPLSLLALAFFFRGWYLAAFALAGASANLHALEAGHVALLMGFAGLCQIRRIGLWRFLAACALFVLAAAPTLVIMASQHQQFDAQWLDLMHIRSADHSFPSAWWQPGDPDLPRFLCILGLAAIAMSYPMARSRRRTVALLFAALLLMFLAGTLFTEWHPFPIVIRAQLFRSSALALVVAFVLIARACVGAWRLPWRKTRLARWQVALEVLSAILTAAAVGLPACIGLLPTALAVALFVALVNRRLGWAPALLASAALGVSLLAWGTIDFVFPPLGNGMRLAAVFSGGRAALGAAGIPLLVAGALLLAAAMRFRRPRVRFVANAAGVTLGALGILWIAPRLWNARVPNDPWIAAQLWARRHTPVDALFLTPPEDSGFRIYSQRAIVGEMRDGTQLYFNAAFARPWWDRMAALQPGILRDPDGRSLMSPGKPLDQLDDAQIIGLAQQFGAQYVVLPDASGTAATSATHAGNAGGRSLEKLYDQGGWAIYLPQLAVVSHESSSVEMREEDRFLRETALPNIDKYRKSDVRVQIMDGDGKPIEGAAVSIVQTSSSFSFGASLSFFKSAAHPNAGADYLPPPVTPAQLDRFLDVFNDSVIPFSGQWRFIEPQRNKPNYADLDAYVAWCREHNVKTELHFAAGYAPAWAHGADNPRLTLAHAAALAKRYGDSIDDWQVTCDEQADDSLPSPALFAELRKDAPHARLGIAEDARFWDGPPRAPGGQSPAQDVPGIGALHQLKNAGVKVDFVSLEARHPTGLWASGADVYALLDAFSAEGVPVHITDFGVPVGERIEGAVREGTWTPQLRAEYYERFFTLCFSHPDVQAIDVMGMGSRIWLDGQGLLDEHDQTTPAYDALRRLITQKWRTQMTGTLGQDGALAFRGFHGAYEMSVTFPGGARAAGSFTVSPGSANRFRYRWDPVNGALVLEAK